MSFLSLIKDKMFSKNVEFISGSTEWYEQLWTRCQINQEHIIELDAIKQNIIKNVKRYQFVEDATGVPWQLVAAIHWRECSGSFNKVLHNGEQIIGTQRKTKLVPISRGPFSSWEESAIDALTLKKIDGNEWSIPIMLQCAEIYNGLGYLRFHQDRTLSPYVWSFTNLYEKGKYSADHKFDPNLVDKQPGVAAILLILGLGDEQKTNAA